MKYFGQLEATCPKSAHNVLGLGGLKIFMTFEEEIKISRQRCCSQACDVCHSTASAMPATCFWDGDGMEGLILELNNWVEDWKHLWWVWNWGWVLNVFHHLFKPPSPCLVLYVIHICPCSCVTMGTWIPGCEYGDQRTLSVAFQWFLPVYWCIP